jgi:hypothetical protein
LQVLVFIHWVGHDYNTHTQLNVYRVCRERPQPQRKCMHTLNTKQLCGRALSMFTIVHSFHSQVFYVFVVTHFLVTQEI